MSNELKDFFDKFNVLQNSRKPPPKNLLLDPIVIIRPDPEVRFQAVVNTVHASRVSYNSQVKVDAGEHLFLLIPELPDVKLIPYLKPNPLTLVVKLDSDGNLTLNNEGNGKLDDLSPLSKRLREIFNEREENGVFRENSNIIETTVFLKVPLSTRFSDVTKIAKSIRDSGSTLIGLQVDEVESAVDFRIEMLTPEIKKPE
jgi:biopolymer transport protein ExbD